MAGVAKLFLGSDHRGFALKSELLKRLQGFDVEDLGPVSLDPEDDYNDFAVKVAKSVLKNPGSFGVLICGSAIGISIQANRFKGVRAAIVEDEETARLSREHNNANVLCLSGSKFEQNPDLTAKLVELFVKTPFSNAPRHVRRVEKLDFNYAEES